VSQVRTMALQSIIPEGCIISGGFVIDSVLGRNMYIHAYSQLGGVPLQSIGGSLRLPLLQNGA